MDRRMKQHKTKIKNKTLTQTLNYYCIEFMNINRNNWIYVMVHMMKKNYCVDSVSIVGNSLWKCAYHNFTTKKKHISYDAKFFFLISLACDI